MSTAAKRAAKKGGALAVVSGSRKQAARKPISDFIQSLRDDFDILTVAPAALAEQYPELEDIMATHPCGCKRAVDGSGSMGTDSLLHILYHLAVNHAWFDESYNGKAIANFVQTTVERHNQFMALKKSRKAIPAVNMHPKLVGLYSEKNEMLCECETAKDKDLDVYWVYFQFRIDDRNWVEASITAPKLWKILAVNAEAISWHDPDDNTAAIMDVRY